MRTLYRPGREAADAARAEPRHARAAAPARARHARRPDGRAPARRAPGASARALPYVALAARLEGFEREDLSRALHDRTVVRATLMRETLHLVTAEDYPHDAVAMAPYFNRLREHNLPDGVDMARVVELAAHATEALAEPLEATALRPILAELEAQMDDDRVWRRVRTNAPILHVPGDEPHAFGQRNRFVAAAAWLGAHEAEEADGTTRLVRRTLAAFGPSSRADLAAFTGLAVAALAPALDGARAGARAAHRRARPRALRPPRRAAAAGRHARAAAPARRVGQRPPRPRRPHAHVRRRDAQAGDPQERRRPADDPARRRRRRRVVVAAQAGRRDARGDAVREADQGGEGRPGARGGARARRARARCDAFRGAST